MRQTIFALYTLVLPELLLPNSLLTRREEFAHTNLLNLTDSAIPADWNLSICDDVAENNHHVVTVHFAKRSAVSNDTVVNNPY